MHRDSTMNKTAGWQTRLLTTVNELKEVPFVWGQNDCCIFVAKCLDAQYGTSIADGIIGQYSTELGSKRFMLEKAKSTYLPTMLDVYITQRVDKKYAQRGDVVTFNGDLGLTAGVLWSGVVWAMGPNGVETFPLSKIEITDIWRM
ncbi:putative minor tail protein [Escherichia phage KurtStettler]|nr:putative minor tail protein [Escherichia phage KurtStettler]